MDSRSCVAEKKKGKGGGSRHGHSPPWRQNPPKEDLGRSNSRLLDQAMGEKAKDFYFQSLVLEVDLTMNKTAPFTYVCESSLAVILYDLTSVRRSISKLYSLTE